MPKKEPNYTLCTPTTCETPGKCAHAKDIAALAMDEARVHTTSGAVKWRGWKR